MCPRPTARARAADERVGAPPLRRALVYVGAGTDRSCVRGVRAQLRLMAARARWRVVDVRAAELARGAWRRDAAIVCLPGGRDLPYLRALQGRAVRHLRAWVAAGGRYFGSCAGAYFAAAALHFAAPKVPRVVGRRPLQLFAGVAVGPSQAAAAFHYGRGQGSVLAVRDVHGASAPSYNRGGCFFVPRPGHAWPRDARVLARADVDAHPLQIAPGPAPVALLVRLQRGSALLWGAHPELSCGPAGCTATHGPAAFAQRAPAPRLLRAHLHELVQGPHA